MRAIFGLVLLAGLALAGAAVYMAQNFIGQTQSALQRERELNAKAGTLVQVYVVNKPKKYGDALSPDDVVQIYWPEKALPENIFRDKALLFPENANGPRYLMRSIEAFEPVLATRVTEPGALAGLTGKLGKGMRAFAIKVGVASGVANFVQPDDSIDIYWTGSTSNSNGEITRLIESAIQVIAVDNASDQGQSSFGTVAQTITVAGTPEQIARLAQAQATGSLSMSLVGDATDVATGTVEVDGDTLLGFQEQEVQQVEAAQVCTIKTRKGADVVEIPIPCKE
ncbi:Flp pilus assembly protein CpaB [Tabrizicola sp. BL-A-41-H6]|uniref:Flp pilus assembly protein CpaB n=1 Tax=Tabrizicola sp. BL-A-41-H6 TaxID=3421107 RepID=UPI003D67AA85